MLLLDRLLTSHTDPASYTAIAELNGQGLFELDLRAWGQKFAFYYRQWEKAYVDLMRYLYSGGTFIDVGSSLGLYVIGLADIVRAHDGRIISIEPVPFNLARQARNVQLNDAADIVTYVTDAVGAEAGSVRINTDSAMADNNAFISTEGDLEVQVVRIDDLLERWPSQRIGMMKVDIEGYEPLAIEGARATLREHQPIILAEFNRERMAINHLSIGDVWRFLIHEIGYRCYALNVDTRCLEPLLEPGDRENLLFCPQVIVAAKLGESPRPVPLAQLFRE